MARVFTLFSSSSGNCTYIGNARGGILVDAGGNYSAIVKALSDYNIMIDSIKGIFITHEHTDHIAALKVLEKHYDIPIYGTSGTLKAVKDLIPLPDNTVFKIMDETFVEIDNMRIRNFYTPHDSVMSCGYKIELDDDRVVGVATDMGHIAENVRKSLEYCDFVVLESNYDLNMLRLGSYPYNLKRRIMGDRGHLCNTDAAVFASELIMSGTGRITLSHLSNENNTPDIAFRTTDEYLKSKGLKSGVDYELSVSPRKDKGKFFVF